MKHFRVVIAFAILIAIGVGYYAYLMNKNTDTPSDTIEVDTVTEIINRDLDNNYPNTPYKVIELYNEIMVAYYEGDVTGEQIEDLAAQSRKIFDEELLAQNPEDTFYLATNIAVETFREDDIRITLYVMGTSDDVTYSTINNDSFASLTVKYILRSGNSSSSSFTYQEYLLRKDDSGRWKIFGWRVADIQE